MSTPTSFVQLSPAESLDLVNQGALLLDVRTQEEWDAGHIEGAVHVPLDMLERSYGSHAALDKAKLEGRTIAVYCKAGPRAEFACRLLAAGGHEHIAWATGYSKLADEIAKRRAL